MSERDLAEAIHQEIISPESVDAALNLWWDAPAGLTARSVMSAVLARTSAAAIDAVLARTGRDAPCEAREACARHIEALATAIRDHGPTSPEGLLTAMAGAQVGTLLDAAASLRTGMPSTDDRHLYQPHKKYPWFCADCGYPEHERLKHLTGPREEEGYPGSLLPPGWPKRGAP